MALDTGNFYCVIPWQILANKNLSSTSKLIYGEISSLTNREGYCWASNKHFAEIFNISETQVSKCINSLRKAGWLDIEIYQEKGNERRIWITGGIKQKLKTSLTKVKDPSLTKVKHSNTNKTIIKKSVYTSMKYLEDLPVQDIKEFVEKFDLTEEHIKLQAEKAADYCRANGKRYKNYKAFLRNWLRSPYNKTTSTSQVKNFKSENKTKYDKYGKGFSEV